MTCAPLYALHQAIADADGYGFTARIVWRVVAGMCGDF